MNSFLFCILTHSHFSSRFLTGKNCFDAKKFVLIWNLHRSVRHALYLLFKMMQFVYFPLSLSSLYIPLVCVWLLHFNKLIIRLNTSLITVLMIQMLLPVIYYLFIVNQISTSSAGPISNENKVNDMYKFITLMLQKKITLRNHH